MEEKMIHIVGGVVVGVLVVLSVIIALTVYFCVRKHRKRGKAKQGEDENNEETRYSSRTEGTGDDVGSVVIDLDGVHLTNLGLGGSDNLGYQNEEGFVVGRADLGRDDDVGSLVNERAIDVESSGDPEVRQTKFGGTDNLGYQDDEGRVVGRADLGRDNDVGSLVNERAIDVESSGDPEVQQTKFGGTDNLGYHDDEGCIVGRVDLGQKDDGILEVVIDPERTVDVELGDNDVGDNVNEAEPGDNEDVRYIAGKDDSDTTIRISSVTSNSVEIATETDNEEPQCEVFGQESKVNSSDDNFALEIDDIQDIRNPLAEAESNTYDDTQVVLDIGDEESNLEIHVDTQESKSCENAPFVLEINNEEDAQCEVRTRNENDDETQSEIASDEANAVKSSLTSDQIQCSCFQEDDDVGKHIKGTTFYSKNFSTDAISSPGDVLDITRDYFDTEFDDSAGHSEESDYDDEEEEKDEEEEYYSSTEYYEYEVSDSFLEKHVVLYQEMPRRQRRIFATKKARKLYSYLPDIYTIITVDDIGEFCDIIEEEADRQNAITLSHFTTCESFDVVNFVLVEGKRYNFDEEGEARLVLGCKSEGDVGLVNHLKTVEFGRYC